MSTSFSYDTTFPKWKKKFTCSIILLTLSGDILIINKFHKKKPDRSFPKDYSEMKKVLFPVVGIYSIDFVFLDSDIVI
jgi:hypothetical protein